MYTIAEELRTTLAEIEAAGLTKRERQLTTAQSAHMAACAKPSRGVTGRRGLSL